jgi:IclR family transcriptional regulator, mhp operon transcriptional activator
MGVKIVRALNRGLDVLQAIQSAKAASLHDLHLATSLPKPTLLRILKTLIGRDLVWQRIADGAYVASYMFSKRAGAIDEESHLAEAAAPILADLCKRVRWPSILAVPRLDHMIVIETNRPMSYFNYILTAPLGFRINMLRSASGRTYLAFCPQKERAAILARLRNSSRSGDVLARSPAKLNKILAETRTRGYGTRDPDFGGHYDQPRSRVDDGRNSIAVPVHVGDEIVGCVNLTWMAKVATVKTIAENFLSELGDAARTIGQRMSA